MAFVALWKSSWTKRRSLWKTNELRSWCRAFIDHRVVLVVCLTLKCAREAILKNRRTNRLLMELQEERVQRLQDLQEIYAKDKQLEALASEVVRKLSSWLCFPWSE